MKSILSIFLVSLLFNGISSLQADTKVASTDCQYIAPVPGTVPLLHEVQCGKIRGFITGDNAVAKLRIEIKKVSGGKELSSATHEEIAPPGMVSDYLEDSIETNKYLNDKYKLGFEDIVSVVPSGFSLPNDSTYIYAKVAGKYSSIGTLEEIYKKIKDEKDKKVQETLAQMEGIYCFQEKDDVRYTMNYADSCKGDDGKVKPICFMDVHCIKREKGTDKILSYHRTQASCAMVDGACPSANDCARDAEVSVLKIKAPMSEATESPEAPQDGSVAK